MRYLIMKIVVGFMLYGCVASANIVENEEVQSFINEMVSKHGFDGTKLRDVISQAKVSGSVLEAIARPAETLPWYKYRPIFLQPDRVRLGVEFMKKQQANLAKAEKAYGVPREIITAILGVETRYGRNTGNYRVLDSLVTLAFHYPKRAGFFRGELEQFLLLTREQGLDPREVTGSYAGAMGISQFISSSYRNYAVDFDVDGKTDIWHDPADAIGSVANYFKMHGWERGGQIVFRARTEGDRYLQIPEGGQQPDIRAGDLAEYGVYPVSSIDPDTMVKVVRLEAKDGDELWLGLQNFYVITRYNHSPLYAMAVFQLSREILNQYKTES